jgi:hypothetical protein
VRKLEGFFEGCHCEERSDAAIYKDEIPHVFRKDKSEGCGMTIFKALSVKIAQFRIYYMVGNRYAL